MGKAAIVTDAITIVGMLVIGALMFSKVPGMIEDIRDTLSQESVRAQAVEIANLATLVNVSTSNVEIIHKLPSDVSYTITIKGGYVTVEAKEHKAIAKTLSMFAFGPAQVKSLSITKNEIKGA